MSWAIFPGLLALFDIADAIRRNFHLGHHAVDREIDELDRQIRKFRRDGEPGRWSGWPIRTLRCLYAFASDPQAAGRTPFPVRPA